MALVVSPLSEKHRAEIALAVSRALSQWLGAAPPEEPALVVRGLERVLLFLRQNGSPSRQAAHVTSLALAWGEQVARAAGWVWMNVSDGGAPSPGLVAPSGAHACLPVDLVTALVMGRGGASLTGLFRRVTAGDLPPLAPGTVALVGAEEAPPG